MTTNAKNVAKPMMTHVTFLIERSDGTDDVGEYTVLGALNNSEMLIPDDKFAEICREFQARLQLLTNDKVIVQHREDLIDILQIDQAEFNQGRLPEFEFGTLPDSGSFAEVEVAYRHFPFASINASSLGALRIGDVISAYLRVYDYPSDDEGETETLLKDFLTDAAHYFHYVRPTMRGLGMEDAFVEAAKLERAGFTEAAIAERIAFAKDAPVITENLRVWRSGELQPTPAEGAQRFKDVFELYGRISGTAPSYEALQSDLVSFAKAYDLDLEDIADRAESMADEERRDESLSLADTAASPAP
jgi:hypothetical protein